MKSPATKVLEKFIPKTPANKRFRDRQNKIRELKVQIGELEYESNNERLKIKDRAMIRMNIGEKKLELIKVRRNKNSSRAYSFKPTLINRSKRKQALENKRR